MPWDVEYTDEFEDWWNHLTEAEQDDVAFGVEPENSVIFDYFNEAPKHGFSFGKFPGLFLFSKFGLSNIN